MDDLRPNKQKAKKKKQRKNYKIVSIIKKNKWRILLAVFILIIIIFPTQIGEMIGTFIHDFFGTIIDYSNGI